MTYIYIVLYNFPSIADTPPQAATFTPTLSPNVQSSCRTPEQCFSLFFDDALFDYLVCKTKEYAQEKLTSSQLTKYALYRSWKSVTGDEMKAFIAVILNMGIIQLSDLKDYWSTNDTTNLPFFRSVFSRDWLFQIFGALHVGDIDDTTRHGKIQPFLDLICPFFDAAFTPGPQISIDKSVILFEGSVIQAVPEREASPLGNEGICIV